MVTVRRQPEGACDRNLVIPNGMEAPTIWLNIWSANAEKLAFVHGRATRTFSAPGLYYYGTGGGLMWYEEGGVVRVF